MYCFVRKPQIANEWDDYFLQTSCSIKSILATGYDCNKIICVSDSPKYLNRLERNYKIKTHLCEEKVLRNAAKPKRPKLFFYKIIGLHSLLKTSLLDSKFICLCDCDAIFSDNISDFVNTQEDDVCTDRMSRTVYSDVRHDRNKDMEYLSSLTNRTVGYLLSKYGYANYPMGIYWSNFVSMKQSIVKKLCSTWYDMYVDIIKTKHVIGDQDVLTAAISHLGLSYGTRSINKYAIQFCGKDGRRRWRKEVISRGLWNEKIS